jgi:c-di-GMP phosphodiesterase
MDVYVARQPILDKKLNTFGYELLFRDSLDNYFSNIDGDTASSTVLANSFLCIGMEKLTGGKRAFVNFTRDLLLKEMPCLFSPKLLYSELLETIEPEDDLVSAVARMREKGCRFALDDFIFHPKYEPLMRIADIIKIDIRQTPLADAKKLMDGLSHLPIKYLAEKVETREEYTQALDMGFSYFQGYFFSKPEIVKRKAIAPAKVRLLQIIGELNREEADLDQLEEMIKSDVSLSYRLLKYMNSAFYNIPNKITSIKGAMLFLGLTELRKIVTLLVTAKLAESKPSELVRTSVVRAKLCEIAGREQGYGGDPSELFLLGLFSLMDAILDTEMAQIVEQLPVSDQLKSALIDKKGDMAGYLNLVDCYEKGLWNECEGLVDSCTPDRLTLEKYTEAVGWADALFT